MNSKINRIQLAHYFHRAVQFFVVKTGATCLVTAFVLTIGGGLQAYTQQKVTMVASAAWLGSAPEGHIRIYACDDGSPIDRLTIVGNTTPCPGSEVSIISIEDSAKASTRYFQRTLLDFYFMCLLLTIGWTMLSSGTLKRSFSNR